MSIRSTIIKTCLKRTGLHCSFFIGVLSTALTAAGQDGIWTKKQSLGLDAKPRSGAVSFTIGTRGYVGNSDFWEFDPSNNSWTQKASLSGGAVAGFSIGTKGYVKRYSDHSFWELDPVANSWTRKADFAGEATSGMAAFSIGEKGYIGTGYTATNITSEFWEYNPATDVWTQRASYGGGSRGGATGFSLNNKGYTGTGGRFDITTGRLVLTSDFWEYDPLTDRWTQKTDFGGTPRFFASGFSVGGKGYFGTGDDGEAFRNDVWEYDPLSDKWLQKNDFNGSRRYQATAFSIGGKAYLGTGIDESAYINRIKADFWEYNPGNDSWLQKADLGGHPRYGAIAFGINDKGYLGFGENNGGLKTDFWEYNPATDSWNEKATNEAAWGLDWPASFSIGAKGYFATGAYTNAFFEYDPVSDSWTQKADVGGKGRMYAAGFSIGNKGYIGLGNSENDFWQYDPGINAWTRKADFAGTGRRLLTVFSINGKGYAGRGDNYANDFWEYNPATDSWKQKAGFPGVAERSNQSFSLNGKGYLTLSSNDFWEYDPATDVWVKRANFPGPGRLAASTFTIKNKGYLAAGITYNTGQYLNDLWEYTPPPSNAALTVSAQPGTISCFGGTGSINVTAYGGTPPYTGTGTFTNLVAGTYTYTVTDAKGATATITLKLNQPLPVFVSVLPGTITCFGGTTSVLVNATGGTAPFTGVGSITNQAAGGHTYIVTDAKGCKASRGIYITQPWPLRVTVTAGVITSAGGTTTVTVTATGGKAPYTGTGIFTGQAAGGHTYTVTDALGCQTSRGIYIPRAVTLKAKSITGDMAIAESTGSLTVTPNPVQQLAVISFAAAKAGKKYAINITDVAGRQLFATTGITTTGINSLRVSMGAYASGEYIVSLLTGTEIMSAKLVKQ